MDKLRRFLKSALSDFQFMAGVIGIAVLLVIIVFAPLLTKYPPDYYSPARLALPGDPDHWLGTNHLGQDIWSMLVYGARTSLKVALVSSMISGVIGVLIGGFSGFFGGAADTVLNEIINMVMMIPDLFLILMIVAMFGNSITHVMIVIGLTVWTRNAKLMRAQALSLRERTFVMSARAMGESGLQILFKYIIPNGIFPVISNTVMFMSYAVITEASLSFIGLGDPTAISWGQMINDGKQYMTSAPHVIMLAGVAIVITVIIFNLTGDGLNHILDPKRAQRGND